MCIPEPHKITEFISYTLSASLTFAGSFLAGISAHVAEIGVLLGVATYATNAYFLRKNFKLQEKKVNADMAELKRRAID